MLCLWELVITSVFSGTSNGLGHICEHSVPLIYWRYNYLFLVGFAVSVPPFLVFASRRIRLGVEEALPKSQYALALMTLRRSWVPIILLRGSIPLRTRVPHEVPFVDFLFFGIFLQNSRNLGQQV